MAIDKERLHLDLLCLLFKCTLVKTVSKEIQHNGKQSKSKAAFELPFVLLIVYFHIFGCFQAEGVMAECKNFSTSSA